MTTKTAVLERAIVPRLWPGGTVVCIATGPSLTPEDVEYVRNRAHTIAVNDAYQLAPWADVLYACDEKWWGWHKGVPAFTGLKFACASARLGPRASRWPDVQVLQSTGRHGLDRSPGHIRDGHNSGYQAINVAVHLGAARIVLLGYDMTGGGRHFFGKHPDGSGPVVTLCLAAFATLPRELAALDIDLVNCTRETKLTMFARQSLREALP